jgi:hypothetical protein
MKGSMNGLEVRALNSIRSFFGHLDHIIDRHPVLVTMGVLYLLILLGVLFTVHVVRRKAKGLIKPGPSVIFIESTGPPSPPPDTFDPFPPHHLTHCDCDRDYLE